MKKINKFIFITLLANSTIFAEQFIDSRETNPTIPSKPTTSNSPPKPTFENVLTTMTLNKSEANLLPSVEDVIIELEGLEAIQKKRMEQEVSWASFKWQERKLNKKLKELKPAIEALVNFRDYLNRMLAYTKKLQPAVKTPQSLQAFWENLTTIFNMSHEFLEKERFIELYATKPEMQNEIILIMNTIYDNFNRQLQDMVSQTWQELRSLT